MANDPIIKAEHLTFCYPDEPAGHPPVLDDISLEIEAGSFVAILGHNGSGKSTFAKHINALLTPTAGKLWVDGLDTGDPENLLNIRGKVGMVFQNPDNQIVASVVEEDVAFGPENLGVPPAEIRQRVDQALKMVGMYDLREHSPHLLSGGQKQRVAIARALATKPRYLLCDEATSALDPNTTRSILELLREINKTLGVTIIVITHEMKVIDQICDRVAVIDKSCIAEEGRVADVFTSPKSDIARELVLPQERPVLEPTTGGRKVRIIFNGENTQKPVISEMILACRVPVNVLFADTKSVEGAAYGHMIFELPNDEHDAEKVISWLKNSGLTWKEER